MTPSIPEIIAPFVAARRTLEVGDDAPLAEIKRAYRRAALAHPPERDAEAFGRVRAAYELLSNPLETARMRLHQVHPFCPPPDLPAPPDRGALVLAVLRHTIGQLSSDAILSNTAHE